MDTKKQLAIFDRINQLNDELSIVQSDFSRALGEGSRWIEQLVFFILLSLVMTVEIVGLTLTYFTSRSISRGLSNLNEVADEIGKGNFGKTLPVESQDEIGQLTESLNKMSGLLSKSYSELQESQRELEKKIELRTREIALIARDNAKLYEEAKGALKLRDEFLSVASHELRTPITAILLNFQLLERFCNLELTEETVGRIKECIIKSVNMSKKLSSLHNLLMDITKINLGSIELDASENDLLVLTKEAISQTESEADLKGIQIKLNENGKVIGIFDPVRASQVITNLLTNAIKYGGEKDIEVEVGESQTGVFVKVKDYGHGISPENQMKIFERFERVTEDNAFKGMGLGLGLYIAKKIMDSHQGSLYVKSNLGKGSTFCAEFPFRS